MRRHGASPNALFLPDCGACYPGRLRQQRRCADSFCSWLGQQPAAQHIPPCLHSPPCQPLQKQAASDACSRANPKAPCSGFCMLAFLCMGHWLLCANCSFPTGCSPEVKLAPCMHHYSFHRPHSATGQLPPATQIGFAGNNVLRNYS